jgi:hypothetical protein
LHRDVLKGSSRLLYQSTRNDAALTDWFDGSKAVDDRGKPLVVYRGEHGKAKGAFHSRLSSLSFGSREAASAYAISPNDRNEQIEAARVTPVYLRIKNPIVNDRSGDPFIDLAVVADTLGEDVARAMAIKHAGAITNTNNWHDNFSAQYATVSELLTADPVRMRELYLDAYRLLDDPEFVSAAKRAGFDGAIHGGSGTTAMETEYRIFDASQARSFFDLFR